MRKIKLLGLIAFSAFITNCVTPKATSIVKEGTDLNAYKYVVIAPLKYEGGIEDRYGVRAHVEQVLTRLGLRIISDIEGKRLPRTELLHVLACGISHQHADDGMGFGGTYAIVKIEMVDASGATIYSGTGRYQGMSVAGDLTGATNQALEGFVNLYKGFNPAAKSAAVLEFESESKKWETIEKSKIELQAYFDGNLRSLDEIEGIWTDVENVYQIGIFREKTNPRRDFVGIILRTDQTLWKPGHVKIEIDSTAYSSVYNFIYFMGDHSQQGTTATIDSSGLLSFEVKQPDGSALKMTFIRNYPAFVPEARGGEGAGSGSGFLISITGLVATNCHVIDGVENINILIPGHEKEYEASIVLKDENNDLSILRIEGFRYSETYTDEIPYSFADPTSVRVGQEAYTIGYPLGSFLGKSAKLSKGIISSLFGIKDDPRLYQISNPIQPGNSGSPLFNMNGELIGVVVASLNSKYFLEQASIIPQNVNFAIKANYLRNLVLLLPEGNEVLNRKNKLSGMNLETQVAQLSPYVVTVNVK